MDVAIGAGLKNPADAKIWSEARRQWGNLKTIERAVSGTTDTAAEGLITPAKLTNAITAFGRAGKTTYVRGRGDSPNSLALAMSL